VILDQAFIDGDDLAKRLRWAASARRGSIMDADLPPPYLTKKMCARFRTLSPDVIGHRGVAGKTTSHTMNLRYLEAPKQRRSPFITDIEHGLAAA
jgi:hypothetical protein